MMASSLRAVASGQWSGAVKIAFFSAELHLHSRGARVRVLTAPFIINCALRTFLFKYSMTVSTVTAIPAERGCACERAAEHAVMTAMDAIAPAARERLGTIMGKYWSKR